MSVAGPGTAAPLAPAARDSQRGAVLLAVVLLVAAAGAMSVALLERAASAAAELRVRRAVLCARYAALGGLALATTTSGNGAGALIGPRVDSLMVSRVRLGPTWCVLRAAASCEGATRTLDRALEDASVCDDAP